MKHPYIFTDLACEAISVENSTETAAQDPGIKEETISGFRVLTQNVARSRNGIRAGRYETICLPPPTGMTDGERSALAALIEIRLRGLLNAGDSTPAHLMVVGLGNRFLASDAIGPRCVDGLCVTRHLKRNAPSLFASVGMEEVCALSPGVMSQTGIESAEIVRGVVRAVKPDAVVAIDALCARETERLCATVQLSDTGIRPGSGVGNARGEITQKTVGCPVIGVGVPTVVSSSTLIADAIEKSGGNVTAEMESLLNNGRSFYVTLNEISEITDLLASVLSDAINRVMSNDCE